MCVVATSPYLVGRGRPGRRGGRTRQTFFNSGRDREEKSARMERPTGDISFEQQ